MSRKGDRRERELTNLLDGEGFVVMRAPASGAATARELPDILAGNGDSFYAIEAKSRDTNRFYIDGVEIEALFYFAMMFGAKPRIGVRFDNENWKIIHPSKLYVTRSGNYRIDKEFILSEGETIDEL